MYKVIYDPFGERFEVIHDIAQNLILNHGWTQSPVTFVEQPVDVTVFEPSGDFSAAPAKTE